MKSQKSCRSALTMRERCYEGLAVTKREVPFEQRHKDLPHQAGIT